MQQRLQRHLLAQLVTLGDHNITGLLCASGRQSLDWSSDYRMYSRQRVKPEQLFEQVRTSLLEQLPPEEPVVVAVDDTHIRNQAQVQEQGLSLPGLAFLSNTGCLVGRRGKVDIAATCLSSPGNYHTLFVHFQVTEYNRLSLGVLFSIETKNLRI